MVTAMMVVSGETSLLELLQRGELAPGCRILKRCCELIQLGGLRGVSTVGGVLSSLLEPVCDLREHLAKLVRTLLL